MSVLFDEYRVLWCLHQLLPYVDKVLNISGTMDFRPIRFENDAMCRLPLVLACLFLPSNRRLLMLAHVVNVISWSFWMPAVWDHMNRHSVHTSRVLALLFSVARLVVVVVVVVPRPQSD